MERAGRRATFKMQGGVERPRHALGAGAHLSRCASWLGGGDHLSRGAGPAFKPLVLAAKNGRFSFVGFLATNARRITPWCDRAGRRPERVIWKDGEGSGRAGAHLGAGYLHWWPPRLCSPRGCMPVTVAPAAEQTASLRRAWRATSRVLPGDEALRATRSTTPAAIHSQWAGSGSSKTAAAGSRGKERAAARCPAEGRVGVPRGGRVVGWA